MSVFLLPVLQTVLVCDFLLPVGQIVFVGLSVAGTPDSLGVSVFLLPVRQTVFLCRSVCCPYVRQYLCANLSVASMPDSLFVSVFLLPVRQTVFLCRSFCCRYVRQSFCVGLSVAGTSDSLFVSVFLLPARDTRSLCVGFSLADCCYRHQGTRSTCRKINSPRNVGPFQSVRPPDRLGCDGQRLLCGAWERGSVRPHVSCG